MWGGRKRPWVVCCYNAGEHFVVTELLRRDIIAGLAPRNARHRRPRYDGSTLGQRACKGEKR